MNTPFTIAQKKVLSACFLLYTAAYFNRLNLPAALGGIMEGLGISAAQAGLLQTAFAVVYAAGQLINGAVADRVNPRNHLLVGIAGSALVNALMGMASSYPQMLVLCMLNGAFQSMLWTPIIRLIALSFVEWKAREKANALLSLTLVVGHLGAWALAGYLSGVLGWRYSFIASAALVLPVLAAAAVLLPRAVPAPRREVEVAAQGAQTGLSSRALFAATGFFAVLAASVLYGFVKDGVVTWTPTLLQRAGKGAAAPAAAFSLLVPLLNVAGIAVGYLLQRRSGCEHRRMICVMMLGATLLCAPLMLVHGMLGMALLLGCVCACMYGLNPMLTGLIPLEYERVGKVGLTAGLIDSFAYIGSALAGVLAGALYDGLGMRALFTAWALAALAAAAAMHASIVIKNRRR